MIGMGSEGMHRMLGAISDANLGDPYNPIAKPEHRKFQTKMPPIAMRQRGMSVRAVGADVRLKTRIHAMGLHRRSDPADRRRAEMALCKMQVDDWMAAHHLMRKIEVPQAQRAALREVLCA